MAHWHSPVIAARFLESLMHTRIRKFNTRDTYPEQKLDNDLCQAVVARGRMVFVRGQVGQDLDTAVSVGRRAMPARRPNRR
jgi:enamine deaminase RidA (YjgF/YER057c/UK114 family)